MLNTEVEALVLLFDPEYADRAHVMAQDLSHTQYRGRGVEHPQRQLEVFTIAEDIFIRMGTVGEPEQPGRITGQLSRALDAALACIGQA